MNNESLKLEEKYRPQTLDEIVGNDDVIQELKGYVLQKNFHDLLLYGEAGVGKTSAAKCLAKELEARTFYHLASELVKKDRSGGLLYRALKKFAGSVTLESSTAHFNIVILDELEKITESVKDRILESMAHFHKNVRFILVCNDANHKNISEKIRAKCHLVKFDKVSVNDIVQRLTYIAQKENMNISQSELMKVAKEADGSVRKAVIELQSVAATASLSLASTAQNSPPPKEFHARVAKGRVSLPSASTAKGGKQKEKELTPEEIFGEVEIEKEAKNPLQERFEQMMASLEELPVKSTNVEYDKPTYCRVRILRETGKHGSVKRIFRKGVETLFDTESGLSHEELKSKFELQRKTDLIKKLKSKLNDLRMINEEKYPKLEQIGSLDWNKQKEGLTQHLSFLKGEDKKLERLMTKYEIDLIEQVLEIIDKIDALGKS